MSREMVEKSLQVADLLSRFHSISFPNEWGGQKS